MRSPADISRVAVAMLITSFWLAPVVMGAETSTKTAGKPKSPAAGKTATAVHKAGSTAGKKTKSSARRKRPLTHRQMIARVRLDPDRIREIQGALIKAGYLNEEPTGSWDDTTRDAMRRYQGEHGFPATGLPEAKSLMKLGLGPHPLPADLDRTEASRASAEAAPKETPPNEPPPPAEQPGPNAPPKQ